VALGATDGGMAAFEWEFGFAVPCEYEVGRRKSVNGVAIFATVLVRCARELAFMRVGVTVQTELEFDAVHRRFAGWAVALRAGDRGMAAQERIRALRMGGDREAGRLPAIHRVTACTLSAVRARQKLAAMGILVTAPANLVRDRRLEVRSVMAFPATHIAVQSNQRVLGFRMIEGQIDVAQTLPIRVVVARAAVGAKGSLVRILVAILTALKRHPGIADPRLRPIRCDFLFMALRALRGAMCASQNELRS